MAIIKCKMCGGDLSLIEGASTAECEYCGSVQTIPNLDDEKKLIQFERAERLRKQCEFDKAAGIYETIVADFRQEAEAYWGLVLCKYGIEYVDDPATGKKIPTCHRSSFDSIMEDSDFEQALENADVMARRVYRDEAKQIEEIRKGIICVSSNEQPYDIFICYKETSANGDRTLDSVLAQGVYDTLTTKGYRVFFSRITLEDKLGVEYEPYIFAALNSAKIMLVFGTDCKHFDAVWVKNEWSRFLKLIAMGKEKYLIPCYKGIDAYDMPKEFAKLQAQDMGKVGAIQDLLRGIEKLMPHSAKPIAEADASKNTSVLSRGDMALKEGEWEQAKQHFEEALLLDPKCAPAYLGQFLAQEHCEGMDAYIQKRKAALPSVNKQNVVLSVNEDTLNEVYNRYCVKGYLEKEEIARIYKFAVLMYSSEVEGWRHCLETEKSHWEEQKLLKKALRFARGEEMALCKNHKETFFSELEQKLQAAEEDEKNKRAALETELKTRLERSEQDVRQRWEKATAERDADYAFCKEAVQGGKAEELWQAKNLLSRKLSGYRDADALLQRCQNAVDQDLRKNSRKKTTILTAIAALVMVAIGATLLANLWIIPSSKYAKAEQLVEDGHYEEAISTFRELRDFRDSAVRTEECVRIYTHSLREQGKFEDAIFLLQQLEGDQQTTILEYYYLWGKQLLEKEDFLGAIECFVNAGDYQDAAALAQELSIQHQYHVAQRELENGAYSSAIKRLAELGDYANSPALLMEANYRYGSSLLETQPLSALQYLRMAGSFADAEDLYVQTLRQLERLQNCIYVKDSTVVLLMQDGTVEVHGEYSDKFDVSGWTEVVQVSMYDHLVGLRADGTVLATGESNLYGHLNVSNWTDIVQVCAGSSVTVGLKRDGSVVAVGYDIFGLVSKLNSWNNVVKLYNTGDDIAAIRADGQVLVTDPLWSADFSELANIQNAEKIAFGWNIASVLKTDGTVSVVGERYGKEYKTEAEDGWCDLIDIDRCSNEDIMVALKNDGTIISTNMDNYGFKDVYSWKNVVQLSAGDFHYMALCSDGTVLAAGGNFNGECNVSDWKDVVAISSGYDFSVALRRDGTLLVTGKDQYGLRQLNGHKGVGIYKE